MSNEEALLNLKYVIALAIELWTAQYLYTHPLYFSSGGSIFLYSKWIAYFLITTSAVGAGVGFYVYLAWARERKIAAWYIATLLSLLGIGVIVAGEKWVQLNGLVFVMAGLAGHALPLYAIARGVFRVFRFLRYGAFGVALSAISQIGAAWRGEIHRAGRTLETSPPD